MVTGNSKNSHVLNFVILLKSQKLMLAKYVFCSKIVAGCLPI